MIEIHDQFYILATSDRLDERTRVLKAGDTFAVLDRRGDARRFGRGEQGLFVRGTRFLSHFELALAGGRLLLLGSSVRSDSAAVQVDLTNPDLRRGERVVLERGRLHVARHTTLLDGGMDERIEVSNFGMTRAEVTLLLHFDADFADIFEVRGFRRVRRGERLPAPSRPDAIELGYRGLDGIERWTRITSDPPGRIRDRHLALDVRLAPRETQRFRVQVSCREIPARERASAPAPSTRPAPAAPAAPAAHPAARLETSSLRWNDWLHRSAADLAMMVTETAHGPYPYAGIPWFSTPFGRDGLVTAFETLWLDPSLARGVLSYLAATQATASQPERDAEPGKILHEARHGELADLGEVPFGRYYGSVDATPLFVALAGAYFERTGDRDFVAGLWPHVEAALARIDADSEERGFLTYQRRSQHGLAQQGWKDSSDSVFHADGALAEPPIALCEVQGYVYQARREAARIARALDRGERAAALDEQALALAGRFEQAVWCDDLGTYALALDGAGRPCRVRASNAGHCLYTRIAAPARARRVAEALLHGELFSGWGVRTLAASERRYNPMSYHNGSVWPHDNALIAQGLAHYGFQSEALTLLDAAFDASRYVDLHRMPELVCGFARRPEDGPVAYPLACTPQAWAAGAVFLMLQAVLGISISALRREVRLARPILPRTLGELRIHDLRVGDALLDVELLRRGDHVVVNAMPRSGRVQVLVAS
ncbi:MAG TPA: glycogen debranching N-terminal domain-containing protein [Myxococcota bacterium]|nr:glycogen debranching N-terminal domain-containing protein [Myxococcota bacterium]